ncbi:MAG TPA: EamA family transporter [Ktedonobacterales bacterium]
MTEPSAGKDAITQPGTHRGRNAALGIAITLGLVYLIWGSTYLGIHFADETLPPFLMGGTRFLIAGLLMYLWCRLRGMPNPTWRQWRSAGIVGLCLLVGGNGTVIFVETQAPSSIVALLVALVPLWTVVLLWLRRGGQRPTARTVVGVTLGLVGVGLLVLHGGGASGQVVNPLVLLLILSTGAWAYGSLYAQGAQLPPSPLMSTAVEALVGGAVLSVVAVATGEPWTMAWQAVSMKSLLALGYLIIFGSIVAYTSYTWLLKHAPPALVSTYAYVNPVVAVILGWAFDNEAVTFWTLVSASIIVASVVLITLPMRRSARRAAARQAPHDAPETPREPVGALDGSGER